MRDNERDNIKDAQVEEVEIDKVENVIVQEERKELKNNYRTEIILIVVIGVLLGIMLKAEALKTISIGFEDYLARFGKQDYNISAIEKKLIQESQAAQAEKENAQNQMGAPVGAGNEEEILE